MPLNALPEARFKGREIEMGFLRGLAGGETRRSRNVLLKGPRGIGKTELMKQLYLALRRDDAAARPFYYRFRRGALKSSHFLYDFFSRLVRQIVADLNGEHSLAVDMSVPLDAVIGAAPRHLSSCLSELAGRVSVQDGAGGLPAQVSAALSLPSALARCAGRRVAVMLDDFHLCGQLYEREPGDTHGGGSLFGEQMESAHCFHLVAGSPDSALEALFGDDALRGKAERLTLRPLSVVAAYSMFEEVCRDMGAAGVTADCVPLMGSLCGNPLYITNAARAAGRHGGQVGAAEFMDAYAREVVDGETAAYWSSVPEGASGIVPGEDTVLADFLQCARMLDEGMDILRVREDVRLARFGRETGGPLVFEVVIPKASESELVAARAIEQICSASGMDAGEAQRLVLALIEACINAMEHGVGYDDRVFVICRVYPGRLELAVEGQGESFDAGAVLARADGGAPGPESARGRGFAMMKGLVDDVRVERAGDRTRVVLAKTIKPAKEDR